MTAISVIMPCYNQGYQLRRVLEAYDLQTTQQPFEIIAIDDASRDNTYAVLSSFHPQRFQLRAVQQERNRGPAAARNLGIEQAAAPLVVFVGDDILPEPTFIQEHLDAHARAPEVETAILGQVRWPLDMPINTLMHHIDGVGAEQFSFYYFKDGQEYDYRHFYTANISIKRALLLGQEHWFDTDFQFAAYEDVELSFRLAQRGMKIRYSARPLGFHYHYHNIWTFSERQYRAGRMALVLSRKHPRLRSTVLGKKWLPHLAYLAAASLLRPAEAQAAVDLEQTVLRLCSNYEWSQNALTDGLYQRVLHYFYFKGIVEGTFEGTPFQKRAVSLYGMRSLRPILKWFLAESAGRNIPFPLHLIPSSDWL